MKKNGFTLIELIVTVGIIALIGTVISVNVLGLFSNQEDKDYEKFKEQIEEAACMHVDLKMPYYEKTPCRRNGCTVKIETLIGDGYIADDLIDPSTGEKISNNPRKYDVNISWVSNEMTCTMVG